MIFHSFAATKQWNAFWPMFNRWMAVANGIIVQSINSKILPTVSAERIAIQSKYYRTINKNAIFLISVAKWNKLIAKTVKTRERYRGIETSTSESSTIPGLELYDTIDGKFVSNNYSMYKPTNKLFGLLFRNWQIIHAG